MKLFSQKETNESLWLAYGPSSALFEESAKFRKLYPLSRTQLRYQTESGVSRALLISSLNIGLRKHMMTFRTLTIAWPSGLEALLRGAAARGVGHRAASLASTCRVPAAPSSRDSQNCLQALPNVPGHQHWPSWRGPDLEGYSSFCLALSR